MAPRVTAAASLHDGALDELDDWKGLTDAKERKKIQNRLNQRAARRRKKVADAAKLEMAKASDADEWAVSPPQGRSSPDRISLRRLLPQPPSLLTRQPAHAPTALYAQSTFDEKKAFHLLRHITAFQIGGAFDREFWTIDLPRAAQSHPAIWHASLAVAAMHCVSGLPPAESAWGQEQVARRESYVFALEQYNKSIGYVIDIAKQHDPSPIEQEALLLATILFAGLCTLKNDFEEAAVHTNNGLEMFYQWKFWDRAQKPAAGGILVTKSLVAIFSLMEIQLVMPYSPSKSYPSTKKRAGGVPLTPSVTPFESLTDAYLEFQPLMNKFLAKQTCFQDSPDTAMSMANAQSWIVNLRNTFSQWKAKFLRLQRTREFDESDKEGLLALKLWMGAAEIALNSQGGELAYDKYHSAFSHMLDLAKQLFEVSRSSSSDGDSKGRLYSFGASFMEPIYFMMSCRDGTIRRQIVKILREWRRTDGVWETGIIASIVEAVMHYEEASMASGDMDRYPDCECDAYSKFICGSHRVTFAPMELEGKRQARLTMITEGDFEYHREPQEVVITW